MRKNKKQEKDEKNKSSYQIRGLILLLIICTMFYAFSSAKIRLVEERYTVQETTYIEVENVTTKQYNETSYIEVKEDLKKNICSTPIENYYNFDYYMSTTTQTIKDKRIINCSALVTNKENIPGNFTFYVEISRTDGVSVDYQDQTKEIPENNSLVFEWIYKIDIAYNAVCTLKPEKIPTIKRCEYAPEGVQTIKTIPIITTKEINVTEIEKIPQIIDIVKTKQTQKYINRVFGYEQGFYLGY